MITGYPYEESIRVPLVVMDPRMKKSDRNRRHDEFTLNIDLAPTILEAANIPVPAVMQGRNFAPLYLNSDKDKAKESWREEFYYEWFTGETLTGTTDLIPSSLALVRKDTKYIIWPDYNYEELFRLRPDPFEEKNIYNASLQTSKALLDEVKARFKELQSAAKDGFKL